MLRIEECWACLALAADEVRLQDRVDTFNMRRAGVAVTSAVHRLWSRY
jgi:hypothetical protein